MNPTRWRIASLLILSFVAELLLGCGAPIPSTGADLQLTPSFAIFLTTTPVPAGLESNPDYAFAQATVAAGENQLLSQSRKATEDSLAIAQTENAVVLATQQSDQRRQVDLDLQSTAISLNIARAQATQIFLKEQTDTAKNAAAAARKTAAAATQSANKVRQTVIAQAQLTVQAEVSQTAQAAGILAAYPLTATPFAATQAALLNQEYAREQANFVDRVVAPLIPVVATILIILLVILVIVLVKRQFLPLPWINPAPDPRANANSNLMNTIEGEFADYTHRPPPNNPSDLTPENIPMLPCEKLVYVEVVNADEPPVTHWIDEAEQLLSTEGGPQF